MSLLEVLVASTVMTVALVSMAQVLALGTAMNASAGRMTFASVLAAEKQEELRGLDWDAMQRAAGDSVEYLDRAGSIGASANGAAYTREWSITPLAPGMAHVVAVRVVVRTARETVVVESFRSRRTP